MKALVTDIGRLPQARTGGSDAAQDEDLTQALLPKALSPVFSPFFFDFL